MTDAAYTLPPPAPSVIGIPEPASSPVTLHSQVRPVLASLVAGRTGDSAPRTSRGTLRPGHASDCEAT
jgi:hypothetical protein